MVLRTIVLLLALLSPVLALGPSFAQDAASPSDHPPLKIAVYGHYAPFTVIGPDGKPAGLLIDMWKAWSKTTGRPVKFVVSGWSDTLDNVRSGKADIHSGLFENSERSEWMAFSEPIHTIKSGVFFRSSDPEGVRPLSSMAGQRVGVPDDTFQQRFIEENYPQVNAIAFDGSTEMATALLSGKLDAMIHEVPHLYAALDGMGMRGAVSRSPEDLLTNTLHAAVAQGRPELAKQISDGFAAIPKDILIKLDERWLADPLDRYYRPVGIKVVLTHEEEQWLKGNPDIRLAVTTFIKPVDIIDDLGNYSGLNADLIQKLNEKLGLIITPQHYPRWSDVVDNALSGEVDGALSFSRTPERERHMLYTAPYGFDPVIVLARKDDEQLTSFKALKGLTVTMLKGIAFKTELSEAVGPEGKLIEVDDEAGALRQLAAGEVDAHVSTLVFYGNTQRATFTSGLKIATSRNLEAGTLRIAIHKSKPILFSILNKGLNAISRDELASLRTKWLVYAPEQTELKTLSTDEQRWLKAHRNIRVGVMQSWPPFHIEGESGQRSGITMDVFDLVNKRLNGQLVAVPGEWRQHQEFLKDGRLDALMDLTPTEKRLPLYNFTEPYLSVPHVIVAKRAGPRFETLDDLVGKTVALERGFGTVAQLREEHPEITVIEVDDTAAALDAVSVGTADAYIGNRAVSAHVMQRDLITNLSIHGRFKSGSSILAIGSRKDAPILSSIFDKALASISAEEWSVLLGKYVDTGTRDALISTAEARLSIKERAWVQNNTVSVGVEEWAPIIFANAEGKAGGLTGDYLTLLAEKTGLRFEIITDEWDPLLKGLENKTIDLLPATYYTDARATYGLYSTPYFQMREFLYVRTDNTKTRSFDDMAEGRIAMAAASIIHKP
ncbi:transporter substrate-binding domain-containing protein, partial [Pseudomonadota bacterium]